MTKKPSSTPGGRGGRAPGRGRGPYQGRGTRQTRSTTQSRLDRTTLSPQRGIRYPKTHLIPFNGTKEEELAVLRKTLPKDGSHPFKGPYALDYDYGPTTHLNEPEYRNQLPILYSIDDDDDTYAAIEDLLNFTFNHRHIDTRLNVRRPLEPSTVGRYLYSTNLADALYLSSKSTDTSLDSNTGGQVESKEDWTETEHQQHPFTPSAADAPTEQQRHSFAQVVKGTPSASSTPQIDYDNIISNPYDPLASVNESSVNDSIDTNMNPENDILEGIDDETIAPIEESSTLDLETSNHEIDEHYQQQDNLQQLQQDEPSLDAEAEAAYEDRYAAQGRENDEERSAWQQTAAQQQDINAKLSRIEALAKQASHDADTASKVLIEVEQHALLVEVDMETSKRISSILSERENLNAATERRLKDQAEALTVKGNALDAQLDSAQSILDSLEQRTTQGDKIIRAIQALQPTEEVVQD